MKILYWWARQPRAEFWIPLTYILVATVFGLLHWYWAVQAAGIVFGTITAIWLAHVFWYIHLCERPDMPECFRLRQVPSQIGMNTFWIWTVPGYGGLRLRLLDLEAEKDYGWSKYLRENPLDSEDDDDDQHRIQEKD